MSGRLAAAVGLALLAACAGPRPDWRPLDELRRPLPDGGALVREGNGEGPPAVVLYRRLAYEAEVGRGRTGWRLTFHQATRVLTEKGLAWAEVSIPYPAGSRIVALEARVVSPDGGLHAMDRDAVHDEALGASWRRSVFRFPNVQVGCVIEYRLVLHTPGVLVATYDRPRGPLPVLRYEVAITGPDAMVREVKAYNSDVPLETVDLGGRWRVSWRLDHQPASHTEPFAPHWTWSEPWWAYRTRRVVTARAQVPVAEGWADLLGRRLLGTREPPRTGAPAGSPPGCGVACRIERVRREVLTTTPPAALPDPDPAATAPEAPEPSLLRSRHLWARLREAGVEAHLAVLARRYGRRVDLAFPSPIGPDHEIVYVPAQPGLPGALWLDPACETCTGDEIPDWLVGTQAVVLSLRGGAGADRGAEARVQARILRVTGTPAETAAVRHGWRGVLSAEGALRAHVRMEQEGPDAVRQHLSDRSRTPAGWEAWARQTAAERARTARLRSWSASRCDGPPVSRCGRSLELEIPDHAIVAGDRMVVPLSLLSSGWDWFVAPERRAPVVFPENRRIEEAVVLELPEGWTLDEAPEPLRYDGPAVTVEVAAGAPEPGRVTVRRVLDLHAGWHPAEGYAAIRAALKAFAAAREAVVVLRRGGPGPARPAGSNATPGVRRHPRDAPGGRAAPAWPPE